MQFFAYCFLRYLKAMFIAKQVFVAFELYLRKEQVEECTIIYREKILFSLATTLLHFCFHMVWKPRLAKHTYQLFPQTLCLENRNIVTHKQLHVFTFLAFWIGKIWQGCHTTVKNHYDEMKLLKIKQNKLYRSFWHLVGELDLLATFGG